MRDRGYEVEEAIDQGHVFRRQERQAGTRQRNASHASNASHTHHAPRSKSPAQVMLETGLSWMAKPENLKKVLGIALAVADVVLPWRGALGAVHKILGAVAPFIGGNSSN